MKSSSSFEFWEPFIWYDRSDHENIQISYYYIEPSDPRQKIWVRAPFENDFVIEDPYSGQDSISKCITTAKGVKLFKIVPLKKYNSHILTKKVILIALLWLKHDISYYNQILSRHHEFYQCRDSTKEYLLIPLYAELGYRIRKNPVLVYHSGTVKNSLLIGAPDVYHFLADMFENYLLASPIIMNGERKFLVQFNEYPAMFVFKDVNGIWW